MAKKPAGLIKSVKPKAEEKKPGLLAQITISQLEDGQLQLHLNGVKEDNLLIITDMLCKAQFMILKGIKDSIANQSSILMPDKKIIVPGRS